MASVSKSLSKFLRPLSTYSILLMYNSTLFESSMRPLSLKQLLSSRSRFHIKLQYNTTPDAIA
ncbi:hypothetical protein X975_20780, partial [Stegodyphus mimosarum]